MRSPEYRNKLDHWVSKAIEPLGPPDGSMDLIVVGTLLHFDSVLARIKDRAGWETKSFRQLEVFPKRMDLWEKFSSYIQNKEEALARVLYGSNRAAMDEGAVLFWPEVKPLIDVMLMWAESPQAFQSEQQNEPFAENAPFTQFTFFAGREADLVLFGAIDPSMGKVGNSGDPSAILIGGLCQKTGRIDVLEANIRKRLPDMIISDAMALQRQYNCALWFVEAIQFQEFFMQHMMAKAASEGIAMPCLPVKPLTDKMLRIERLQPPVTSGLIRFKPEQKVLLDQLKQFPNGAHDDGPDALEMLWSGALTHGRSHWNYDALYGQSAAPVNSRWDRARDMVRGFGSRF